jgi:hypothetical protein
MSQTTPHSFGKLARVDLRDVWNHDAGFLTPWLEENHTYLSEAIGLPLQRLQREVRYVQGLRIAGPSFVYERLLVHEDTLEEQLTAKFLPNRDGRFLLTVSSHDQSDRAGWDELYLWPELTTRYFEKTRREKFQIQTP